MRLVELKEAEPETSTSTENGEETDSDEPPHWGMVAVFAGLPHSFPLYLGHSSSDSSFWSPHVVIEWCPFSNLLRLPFLTLPVLFPEVLQAETERSRDKETTPRDRSLEDPRT
jgi:hypothetical protein